MGQSISKLKVEKIAILEYKKIASILAAPLLLESDLWSVSLSTMDFWGGFYCQPSIVMCRRVQIKVGWRGSVSLST